MLLLHSKGNWGIVYMYLSQEVRKGELLLFAAWEMLYRPVLGDLQQMRPSLPLFDCVVLEILQDTSRLYMLARITPTDPVCTDCNLHR